MAQREIITLADDLDGTDIPRGIGETVRFGIDGRTLEIDLSNEIAKALRQVLQPVVAVARRDVPAKPDRTRR